MCDSDRTRAFLPELARGDEDAFWAFYMEFSPCASKSAWETNDHEKQDVTFDAFEKIRNRAMGGDIHDLNGGYIHTKVKDESRLRWLRKTRRPNEVAFSKAKVTPETNRDNEAFFGLLSPAECREEINRIFLDAKLSEQEQMVLKLKFLEGMTQAEIADRLGVSRGTVSRLYLSALQKLRDWCERLEN